MDKQVEMKSMQMARPANADVSEPELGSNVLDTDERMNNTEFIGNEQEKSPNKDADSAQKMAGVPSEEVLKVELPIKEVYDEDIQQAIEQEAFKHDKNRNIQEIIAEGEKVTYLELIHHI